jgi:hypothetical protein
MFKKSVFYSILFLVLFPLSIFGQNTTIDSLVVQPLDSKINSNTLYKITFVSSVDIPSGAQIILIFPPEFDLSQLSLAGSNKIDGGFLLTKDGQRIVVQRKGEGNIVSQRSKVDLLLSVIKNPSIENSTYQLQFQILTNQSVSLTDIQTVDVAINQ